MRKKTYDNRIVTTLIGEDTEVKGSINTQGSVRIEGKLEGEINAQGEVHIGIKSKVKGNVHGRQVIVSGEVVGNVEVIKGLEIARTGRVYGDITGDRLVIQEGAIYRGKVNMDIISAKNMYEGNLELVKKAS